MREYIMANTNGNSFGDTQHSEAERSEAERSGVSPKLGSTGKPDPEVSSKPKRRRFTNAYKLKIVLEADKCTEKGQIGALLRREGLYSSSLDKWRKQRDKGILDAFSQKRGRKPLPVNPMEEENKRLLKEKAQLEKKLIKAEAIIEFQKKISELLGISMNPEGEKRKN